MPRSIVRILRWRSVIRIVLLDRPLPQSIVVLTAGTGARFEHHDGTHIAPVIDFETLISLNLIHPQDLDQGLFEILGALGTADDDAGRIIGLHAAVEQMQGFADET